MASMVKKSAKTDLVRDFKSLRSMNRLAAIKVPSSVNQTSAPALEANSSTGP